MSRAIPVLIACFILSACVRGPEVAQGQYAGITAAARLMMDSAAEGPVASQEWPAEIAALQPIEVIAKADGLYIATSRLFVREAGVFVPRSPEKFSPRGGVDPSYAELAPGLFEYRIEG